jgi:methylmalonyl-CoA mutase
MSAVTGGVIPKADARQLPGLEVKACFGPGQEVIEIIEQLVDLPPHCHPQRLTST